MKKFLFSGLLCGVLGVWAAEIMLGGGIVSDARLSRKMPAVAGFDAAAFPGLPERRVYAALTIEVPETRKISIFDYQLELLGRDYPCVALRGEGGRWTTTEKTFPGGKKYSLLFILNGGMIGTRAQETITLKNRASQTKTQIQLQNLGEVAL